MGRVRVEVLSLDRALCARAAGRCGYACIPRAHSPLARRLSALGPRYAGLRAVFVLSSRTVRRLRFGLQRFSELQPFCFEPRKLPRELALASHADLQCLALALRI